MKTRFTGTIKRLTMKRHIAGNINGFVKNSIYIKKVQLVVHYRNHDCDVDQYTARFYNAKSLFFFIFFKHRLLKIFPTLAPGQILPLLLFIKTDERLKFFACNIQGWSSFCPFLHILQHIFSHFLGSFVHIFVFSGTSFRIYRSPDVHSWVKYVGL